MSEDVRTDQVTRQKSFSETAAGANDYPTAQATSFKRLKTCKPTDKTSKTGGGSD